MKGSGLDREEVLKRSAMMLDMTEGKKTARAGELMHWFWVLRDLEIKRSSVTGLPI